MKTKREIIITADGSTTIFLPELNEQYHSKHGALDEAFHVFIKNGLEKCQQNPIKLLEIGFGTGLNCFITLLEAAKKKLEIDYSGLEAYPISEDEILQLNFVNNLETRNLAHKFEEMHLSPWSKPHKVTSYFNLNKICQTIEDFNSPPEFDLIYFDAFGARVQPELWTETIFQKMINCLKPGGQLVTYSAKGSVRRAMQAVGFTVQKLPGPPGKREMLHATKPLS